MSDPFTDLKNALANASGMDLTLAGYVLGIITTVGLTIMMVWIFDPKGKGSSQNTLVLSAAIGMIVCTLVGWFPIWVVVFLGLIAAFIVFNPFAKGSDS